MEEEARERRLVLRIMAQWKELSGERRFPARADIDPAGFADDWPFCFLLDFDPLPVHPADGVEAAVITYVGSELVSDAAPPALVGRRLVQATRPDSLLRFASSYIDRVIEREVPVCIGGPARHRGKVILTRSILLPLSSDGARIDGALGAANYRLVDGDWGQE
jgi:hypothetical protein